MADSTPFAAPSAVPFAVVTGASSGIGFELAKQFAAHGFDLLITAESAAVARNGQVVQDLRASGVQVESVRADLRTAEGVEHLYAAVRAAGRPVRAAALNAGVGLGGSFLDGDLDAQLAIIDLNVRSTVHLAKLVLTDMVAAGEGKVLLTSSIAATMPGSFQAVYNASKSFLQSFAQALAEELKDTGVSVTALMPGPTETRFFSRAGMNRTRVGQASKDDPAQVARQGFEALMSGRGKIVAGSPLTKAQGLATRVLPDSFKAALHRRMAEPTSTGPTATGPAGRSTGG